MTAAAAVKASTLPFRRLSPLSPSLFPAALIGCKDWEGTCLRNNSNDCKGILSVDNK